MITITDTSDRLGRITLDDERDYLTFRRGSGQTVEILDIAVGTERGKGKGRQLIDALLHLPLGARTVWAFVRIDNVGAHQFYEKCGFAVLGLLRDFYRDDPRLAVDAVVFGRKVG